MARVRSAVAAGALLVCAPLGGAALAGDTGRPFVPTGSYSVPQQASPIGRWEVYGRSAEGRPLEFVQFGSGPRHVLIVGELSGRTSMGVQMADRLAEHLARFPRRLEHATVWVVRDPNPDGRMRGTAGNARGVEIDRNFFTANWRRVPVDNRHIAGSEPESEPETKALVDLISDVKPEVVLLFSTGSQARLYAAGSDAELVRQVSLATMLRPQAPDAELHTGSLLALAADRHMAAFWFHLAGNAALDTQWDALRRGLMLLVDQPLPTPAAGQSLVPVDDRFPPAAAPAPPTPSADGLVPVAADGAARMPDAIVPPAATAVARDFTAPSAVPVRPSTAVPARMPQRPIPLPDADR